MVVVCRSIAVQWATRDASRVTTSARQPESSIFTCKHEVITYRKVAGVACPHTPLRSLAASSRDRMEQVSSRVRICPWVRRSPLSRRPSLCLRPSKDVAVHPSPSTARTARTHAHTDRAASAACSIPLMFPRPVLLLLSRCDWRRRRREESSSRRLDHQCCLHAALETLTLLLSPYACLSRPSSPSPCLPVSFSSHNRNGQ